MAMLCTNCIHNKVCGIENKDKILYSDLLHKPEYNKCEYYLPNIISEKQNNE